MARHVAPEPTFPLRPVRRLRRRRQRDGQAERKGQREREREKKTRVKIEMIWPLISFCLFFCLFVCFFISLFVLLEPLLKAKPQIISDLIVDQVFYYWTTCWGTFFDQGPMLIAALFNQTIKNGFGAAFIAWRNLFEHCAVPRISQDLCC